MRRLKAAVAAASTFSIDEPSRPSLAMRSTQRTKVSTTSAKTTTVRPKSATRPPGWKNSFFIAVSATTPKMNAPMKVESAFCDTSSAMTSGNERGVAALLAEA